MTDHPNPFVFAGANDLPPEMVLDYYNEDFNYSRFIQSKRNILLIGERGCGKSMTLLYNSWPLRLMKAERDAVPPPFEHIGVYVPCNTPLIHKAEYELLSDFRAALLSEHSLVVCLLFEVAKTLSGAHDIMEGADESSLRSRLEFILDDQLPEGVPFFQGIQDFAQRVNLKTQQAVSDDQRPDVMYEGTYSFSSLIVPFLGLTRSIPALEKTHFMILIDDAHYLNPHQLGSLCSWIAYRDHSLFSFKIAMANIPKGSSQNNIYFLTFCLLPFVFLRGLIV